MDIKCRISVEGCAQADFGETSPLRWPNLDWTLLCSHTSARGLSQDPRKSCKMLDTKKTDFRILVHTIFREVYLNFT